MFSDIGSNSGNARRNRPILAPKSAKFRRNRPAPNWPVPGRVRPICGEFGQAWLEFGRGSVESAQSGSSSADGSMLSSVPRVDRCWVELGQFSTNARPMLARWILARSWSMFGELGEPWLDLEQCSRKSANSGSTSAIVRRTCPSQAQQCGEIGELCFEVRLDFGRCLSESPSSWLN